MSSEFEPDRPLHSKSALLVCSPLKSRELIDGLEALGAEVIPFQAIEIRPLTETARLDSALRSLGQYSVIIFTSSYAVSHFSRRMLELGVPVREAAGILVCAIGPATAKAAAEFGLNVSVTPREFVAEGLLKELSRHAGGLQKLQNQRILIPRARDAREVLPQVLRDSGAIVDVAPCYETMQAAPDNAVVEKIRVTPPHLAVFTSSSNVDNFVTIVGREDAIRLFRGTTVAVIGPITAETVAEYGKSPEILPDENTIPGLLKAVGRHFRKRA